MNHKPLLPFIALTIPYLVLNISILAQELPAVQIWEEELILPTYLVDPPEKAPMFFDHDSYQGASRVIYPYPLEDDFTDEKVDKAYKAVYIENEYIKVCVLPEVGGRLFYATDKTNDYELFYRQHVIKPAHIGMLGAWISGGIEFCVFHHHRATTNMPVDYDLVKNEDGSATLWIGETELRHRMKWTFGIRLHPGKSYLELDGRLINPTANVNSILYWANVATSVNEDYQIIFPPSTQFAVFHAKNSFSHWPITQEAYRGNPYYEHQIDASYWKNHPNPNSFFAHDLKEGFLAGYDYGKQAGTMVVGNPHIVKGAKLWEWGTGSIWDTHILTDEDGPYAELMSGAYSDNQPDYSWLKPYEFKQFKQYWYPMRESRGALSANLNGFLNLEAESDKQFFIAANTTTKLSAAKLTLSRNEEVLFEEQIDISPEAPFHTLVKVDQSEQKDGLKLALYNSQGQLLISYEPSQLNENEPLPEVVKPPLAPQDIQTIEELYLTGLRIKQFYNARIDPVDYFVEALKRDPLDTRSNTQMGIIEKEKGDYEKAAQYFRKALVRLTANYTRPRNCEAFYHLGLILQAQGKLEAAYDTLYRAAWDHSFTAPAYYHLAEISTQRNDYQQALIELERCLMNNASHLNALMLSTSIYRKLGQSEQAKQIVEKVVEKDPLNFRAHYERILLTDLSSQLGTLADLMRDEPESYLELAIGYIQAGLFEEARQILVWATESEALSLALYPTIHYYLGYLYHIQGNSEEAKRYFNQGQSQSTDYCFPFRLESIKVFESALAYHAEDAKAHYYLGNLLYDKQAEKAITHWVEAVAIDPEMAIAHRNLGCAYYQTEQDLGKAISAYEQAISVDDQQPRYFAELDRLYEQGGAPIDQRFKLLAEHHEVVAEHNHSLIREALVATAAEEYDHAIDLLTSYYFSRQEGNNQIRDIYVDARLLRGKQYLQEKKWELALADFQAADLYPTNQSIGENEKAERRAQIYYFTGLALEKMGKKDEAHNMYQQSINIETDDPAHHFHQALAFQKVEKVDEAMALFAYIEEQAQQMLQEKEEIDFFSKFGGNQLENKRKASAHYLLGLAMLGNGNTEKAISSFRESIELFPGHAWARRLLHEVK